MTQPYDTSDPGMQVDERELQAQLSSLDIREELMRRFIEKYGHADGVFVYDEGSRSYFLRPRRTEVGRPTSPKSEIAP